ncbi:MAG: VWA domain-containing protein, partial [Vicinamibacteria bacterium]
VRLASDHAALDRDFVLTADASAFETPQAWVEDRDGNRSIAVACAPRVTTSSSAADVVFVVDRSGSMTGEPIDEVRNALQLCLRSLTSDCTFNIIGFGHQYTSLFSESRVYDQASLDEATRHVERIQADMGGTEIEAALRFALEGAPTDGRRRQVLVLTDGGVTNTDQVIALAHAHRDRARVFSLGIGMASSHYLVRGLARAGRGVAEFIHPRERIERKVLRLLGRMLAPALDVRLEWVGGAVTAVPRDLPPVFDGLRLLTYGLVPAGAPMPTAARLTAHDGSHTTTWEVQIPADATDGTTVSTLAARARIRELEEAAEGGGPRGSQQHPRRASAARQEIIDLAIRHGLVSRETSYVAVERRATPVVGPMTLRRVPILLPSGWERVAWPLMWGAPQSSVAVSAIQHSFVQYSLDWPYNEDALMSARSSVPPPPSSTRSFWQRMPWARADATDPTGTRPAGLDALVALQAADGSWALDERLAGALGRTLADLAQTMPPHLAGHADGRRAWATTIALAWLEQHAADYEDEWTRLADKARQWIAARLTADERAALSAAVA